MNFLCSIVDDYFDLIDNGKGEEVARAFEDAADAMENNEEEVSRAASREEEEEEHCCDYCRTTDIYDDQDICDSCYEREVPW